MEEKRAPLCYFSNVPNKQTTRYAIKALEPCQDRVSISRMTIILSSFLPSDMDIVVNVDQQIASTWTFDSTHYRNEHFLWSYTLPQWKRNELPTKKRKQKAKPSSKSFKETKSLLHINDKGGKPICKRCYLHCVQFNMILKEASLDILKMEKQTTTYTFLFC